MTYHLLYHRNGREERVSLSGDGITIGRGPQCDLQIADERVSSRHCRILLIGQHWTLQDLRSANGTFVNDQPVIDRLQRLDEGDWIRLGTRQMLLFEAQFVSDRPRPAQPPGTDTGTDTETERLRARVTELQAALAERDGELSRLRAMCKSLDDRLRERVESGDRERHRVARIEHELAMAYRELDEARAHLAIRSEELERLHRAHRELESRLRVADKRGEAEREQRRLEQALVRATADLASARAEAALARQSAEQIKDAYADLLAGTESREALPRSSPETKTTK